MTQGKDMMEQPTYPVKYIQTLRGGTAHVIHFSDGINYVVKWNAVNQIREKEVVNEYVIGKLAELLSLPTIPFRLVYITEEFIQKTPELQSKKFNYSPGYQYGCVFIENSLAFEDVRNSPPTKEQVKNRDMLAGITVFDQWVVNTDRGTLNVLLEKVDKDGFYVYMIDHGRCFPGRYQWSAKTLGMKEEYKYHWPFYSWAFSLLDNHTELTEFVEKIENLSPDLIYNVIQSIPNNWNVSTEDKDALYKFLIDQRRKLPGIVNDIINYYSNRRK
jgi:hypothetical protein